MGIRSGRISERRDRSVLHTPNLTDLTKEFLISKSNKICLEFGEILRFLGSHGVLIKADDDFF